MTNRKKTMNTVNHAYQLFRNWLLSRQQKNCSKNQITNE